MNLRRLASGIDETDVAPEAIVSVKSILTAYDIGTCLKYLDLNFYSELKALQLIAQDRLGYFDLVVP